jgi:diacylglycerol kinase
MTPDIELDEEVRQPADRSWARKFADALRGLKIAFRSEINFFVHMFVAVIAGVAGGIVTMADERWCIYILCVTIVLSAELFNTAIERLARAVTREEHPEVRDALDIAAGAVLMASIGAGVVGALMIGWPFVAQLAR